MDLEFSSFWDDPFSLWTLVHIRPAWELCENSGRKDIDVSEYSSLKKNMRL